MICLKWRCWLSHPSSNQWLRLFCSKNQDKSAKRRVSRRPLTIFPGRLRIWSNQMIRISLPHTMELSLSKKTIMAQPMNLLRLSNSPKENICLLATFFWRLPTAGYISTSTKVRLWCKMQVSTFLTMLISFPRLSERYIQSQLRPKMYRSPHTMPTATPSPFVMLLLQPNLFLNDHRTDIII